MEPALFQNKEVYISKTLAKFGGTTYPINAIGSVGIVRQNSGNKWGGGIILLFISIVVGSSTSPAPPWTFIAGILALALLWSAWRSPYFLMLHVNSGDRRAYQSQSLSLLSEIKDAIESAAIMRG